MAEKQQQSAYPVPVANGYGRRDTEMGGAAHDARELRRKKRNKCLLYVAIFAVFQIGVITLFGLTIMRVRTPRFRIRSAELANLNFGTPASPSISGRINAEFAVKNANFGRYKYRDTTVVFMYRGATIGQVEVSSSRAGWRSTKKFDVTVDLNSAAIGGEELSRDLSSGVLPITSHAKLRGRVELVFVMKKNRSTDMNCTMEIVRESQQIRNIVCK